jgi:C-terminal processing protease CtpA/Prc
MVSTSHMFEESSGRDFERNGVLPDIATTSEEAIAAALEHARETIRAAHVGAGRS